jgi:hypothetical protein
MLQEISETTYDLIEKLVVGLNPAASIDQEVARAALVRTAHFFGELVSTTGNLWDVRDSADNLVLGKFTYSTAAGLLPGTTLEQHGALEYHARTVLGVLDDQYVVDRLDQVLNGRPISLMGYISGGTSARGQVALQIDPALLYQSVPESDRLYEAVSRCAYSLVRSGLCRSKPVAFHAEINNRYGFSQTRKEEYDLLKSVGVAEEELPLYRAHIYLTMPQVLPLNEDLRAEELFQHTLGYWARL